MTLSLSPTCEASFSQDFKGLSRQFNTMNETWYEGTGAITATLPRGSTVQADTASDSGATAGILEKLYLGYDDCCGHALHWAIAGAENSAREGADLGRL